MDGRLEIFETGLTELKVLGINRAKVSRDDIVLVKTNSKYSHGYLRKFNVFSEDIFSDFVDVLYVKAGRDLRFTLSVMEPITEYIAYRIGEYLGFDIQPVQLWAFDYDLFVQEETQDFLSLSYSITPLIKDYEPKGPVLKPIEKVLEDRG